MTTETSSSTAPALVPYTGGLHPLHSAISQVNARQEARMQEIMARSLKAHFADFNAFHSFGKGDIVVLVGTSTAGKSSIIRALKELEPDRLEDGGDIRVSVK
jgi:ABC-type phosphate/phosphonate transport system ATPase subunit